MAKVAQKLNLRWPGKATEEVSLYDSTTGMKDGYVVIKETYQTVADIAERNNLMVNNTNIGMIVKVNSENKYYKLTSVAAANLYYTTSSSNWTVYNYTGKTYYAALSLVKNDKTSSLRVKHAGVTKYVLKEFATVPDFGRGNKPGELDMSGGTLTRGANGQPFEGGSYCSVPDKWIADLDTITLTEGKYKMTLTASECGMKTAYWTGAEGDAPGGSSGYRPENVRGEKGDNTPRYYDGVKTGYQSAREIGYDYAAFAGVRFKYLDGRPSKWPLVAAGAVGRAPFSYTSTYTIGPSETGKCYVHVLLNAIDGWSWTWNSRGAIMKNPHLKIVAIN